MTELSRFIGKNIAKPGCTIEETERQTAEQRDAIAAPGCTAYKPVDLITRLSFSATMSRMLLKLRDHAFEATGKETKNARASGKQLTRASP